MRTAVAFIEGLLDIPPSGLDHLADIPEAASIGWHPENELLMTPTWDSTRSRMIMMQRKMENVILSNRGFGTMGDYSRPYISALLALGLRRLGNPSEILRHFYALLQRFNAQLDDAITSAYLARATPTPSTGPWGAAMAAAQAATSAAQMTPAVAVTPAPTAIPGEIAQSFISFAHTDPVSVTADAATTTTPTVAAAGVSAPAGSIGDVLPATDQSPSAGATFMPATTPGKMAHDPSLALRVPTPPGGPSAAATATDDAPVPVLLVSPAGGPSLAPPVPHCESVDEATAASVSPTPVSHPVGSAIVASDVTSLHPTLAHVMLPEPTMATTPPLIMPPVAPVAPIAEGGTIPRALVHSQTVHINSASPQFDGAPTTGSHRGRHATFTRAHTIQAGDEKSDTGLSLAV